MIKSKYLVKENKVVSSGLIITDKKRFLACKSSKNNLFDLPKGKAERKESVWQACVREVWEETGLDVKELPLIHLGVYEYNEAKFLSLFILVTRKLPDINELKCHSFYERNGKLLPEVNEYKYIHFDASKKFMNPCMQRLIETVKNDVQIYSYVDDIEFITHASLKQIS